MQMANNPRSSKRMRPPSPTTADPPVGDKQTDFGFEVWLAEQRAKKGQYVAPSELAGIVAGMGDNPLPGWLREQVCSHLRGEAKRPRGRPATDHYSKEWRGRMLELAEYDYHRLLALLKRRTKRRRTAGENSPNLPSKFDGAPHEAALRWILKFYKKRGDFKSIDERRFRNLISRQ